MAADVGQPKGIVAARYFAPKPDFTFVPVLAGNESPDVDSYYQQADWVVCASNTVESRTTSARKAIALGRSLMDIGVADGRSHYSGTIKYKLPQCPWSACPACYFTPQASPIQGEGLLFSILAALAGLASHFLLMLLAGRTTALQDVNLLALNLAPPPNRNPCRPR